MRPALPQMRFIVGDRLSWEGAKPQFSAIFAEFKHLFFRKNAEHVPFGWIWNEAGAEMCLNGTFWRGDCVPDGLGEVEMEGIMVLEAKSHFFSDRSTE